MTTDTEATRLKIAVPRRTRMQGLPSYPGTALRLVQCHLEALEETVLGIAVLSGQGARASEIHH